MKTSRESTWESNSSSTHSVTISSKSKAGDKGQKPLVTDDVLDPSNLRSYEVSIGESAFLTCDTTAKKIAIVVHWLHSRLEESSYDKGEDIFTEEKYNQAIYMLTLAGGYVNIKPLKSYDYYPSSEYVDAGDEDYMYDLSKGNYNSFKKFILNVILDDDTEIVDSDTAN
jgi:hypothetical protein